MPWGAIRFLFHPTSSFAAQLLHATARICLFVVFWKGRVSESHAVQQKAQNHKFMLQMQYVESDNTRQMHGPVSCIKSSGEFLPYIYIHDMSHFLLRYG